MLDVCCVHTSHDEYIAMVKTGNECQLSAYKMFVGNLATAVCCAEVLFQPSFLCVTQRVAWCVASGVAARNVPSNLALQRLSAYSQDLSIL